MNRYLLIFLFVTLSALIGHHIFQLPFGDVDFYQRHGFFFLIAIAIFPRLTLLFSSVASGGLLWWLGFVFCPRFLVACLATVTYLRTNPILVTISWAMALSGESMEKMGIFGVNKAARPGGFNIRFARMHPRQEQEKSTNQQQKNLDAIEVPFRRHDDQDNG
jgi:hypothetical protein